MQMRHLKNAGRGKCANDRRNYSKEKEERLMGVGIGRRMYLTRDHATENAPGIRDTGRHLGHRQCERDLLLEDTNGVGPVPVSIVETTIAVGHSRRYFVFEAYSRVHPATNQSTLHIFLSILSIHLADRNYWLPVYCQKKLEGNM